MTISANELELETHSLIIYILIWCHTLSLRHVEAQYAYHIVSNQG